MDRRRRDNFALSQYYTGHDDGGSNGFWGGFEPYYRPPLGINLLCYLQEMNEATGPRTQQRPQTPPCHDVEAPP